MSTASAAWHAPGTPSCTQDALMHIAHPHGMHTTTMALPMTHIEHFASTATRLCSAGLLTLA